MSDLKLGTTIGIIATTAVLWTIVANQKPMIAPVEYFECRDGQLWYGYDEHDVRPLKTRLGVVKCNPVQQRNVTSVSYDSYPSRRARR
jgi:hypothetical protein